MLNKVRSGGKLQSSKGGKDRKSNPTDQSKSSTSSSSSGPRTGKMFAVVGSSEGGGPEVLQVQSVPKPIPKANEVLVDVAFAVVNGPDVDERRHGMLSPKMKELENDGIKSKYLGLECSGTIVAHGVGMSKKDVQNWKIGTKVCAIVFGGAYAEYVAVPIGHLLRFKSNIPMEKAAAIPQAACTVWSELFMSRRVDETNVTEKNGSRLSSGETILIHGGCSGTGMLAIQMAKNHGTTVFATAGTDVKVAQCQKLKADFCINYKKKDFVEEIKGGMTEDQGAVDVILDCVGFDYYQKNLDCLKDGGRLIQIGGCWMVQHDSHRIVQKGISDVRCTDVASLVFRTPEMKEAIIKEVQENVIPAIEEGRVEVVIHSKIFTFKEAAMAHKLKESGDHIGKIILRPGKLR